MVIRGCLAAAPTGSHGGGQSAALCVRHLAAWGCDGRIADAELLVSELVTNAVLHARLRATVTVERDGMVLRVSVQDDSPAQPHLRELGPEAVTGRGLLLVDRIARRWGVDPQAGGKCVWFEVDGRARVSES